LTDAQLYQGMLHCSLNPCLLYVGVKIAGGGDSLGQQYVSPVDAVTLRGADIIIVGRGITHSTDRVAAAQEYQRAGFTAYENLRTAQKSDR